MIFRTFNNYKFLLRYFGFIYIILFTISIPLVAANQNDETITQKFSSSIYDNSLKNIKDLEQQLSDKNTPIVDTPKLYRLLAEAYSKVGNQNKAFSTLTQALSISNQLNTKLESLKVLMLQGSLYAQFGQLHKAERNLTQSITISRSLNQPELTLVGQNNLANVYVSLGQYDRANEIYAKIISSASETQNYLILAKSYLNLAHSHKLGGDLENTKQNLHMSNNIISKLPSSSDKAKLLLGIGELFHQIDVDSSSENKEMAFKSLNQAKEISILIKDNRSLSYAYGYLGNLYENAERTEDALVLTNQAVHLSQLENMPESLYLWYWQTGRLLKQQGDTPGAIKAYQNSIETLETIKHLLLQGNSRNGRFRKYVGSVYIELTDLLLKSSSEESDSQKLSQILLQAREIMESFKSAELQDYFQDDCVAKLSNKTRGIDKLDENTAAIYPIVFSDRIEILLSLPNGLVRYLTKVDEKTLTNETIKFRRLIEKRTTRQYLKHAKKLHQWLIKPIEKILDENHINTLVVIPDGILRTIPFSALHDGDGFLIQKYAIAVTPGLSLTDPQPLARDDISVMASGITEATQDFPALPFVADELESIDSLYDVSFLQDKHFTNANFKNSLKKKPFNIVHIASHGQFSNDIQDSFLLTYSSKLTMSHLESYLLQTKFRDKPIELLTLSACQTATGDDRAALGLAGIAVKAGVRSAVATLWFVNDKASSNLVSEFYTQLNNASLSKAKALQNAQIALILDKSYDHPSYWSPFLLIGNWL